MFNVGERERLSEEIDKCLNDRLNRFDSVKIMSHTPLIFQKSGLEDKPILMSQHHVRTCMHPKGKNIHWHGMSKNDLMQIPEIFTQPAMLFDSLSDDYSIVAVTNKLDNDKLPIMASIQTNGIGNYECRTIKSNYLTSIYGKDNFENFFKKSLDNNCVLYINKEKTQELESVAKLQLLRECSNLELNTIIHKSENIVNESPKPVLDTRSINEFNNKWNKYNFRLISDDFGIHFITIAKTTDFKDPQYYGLLGIDGSGDFEINNNVNFEYIEWIPKEDKKFYQMNPDSNDLWNDQFRKFHKVRTELTNDLEYMFRPSSDQADSFYNGISLIKENMEEKLIRVSMIENKQKHEPYNVSHNAKDVSQSQSIGSQNHNKEER